jgi:hypothetical protein
LGCPDKIWFFSILIFVAYALNTFVLMHFTGKLNAYERAARTRKKFAYGGPVGRTGLDWRYRPELSFQDCAWPYSWQFRDFAAPYRAARSSKKFPYGVLRTGIRVRTVVLDPLAFTLCSHLPSNKCSVSLN